MAVVTAACTGGYADSDYRPVVDVHGSRGKDPARYEIDLAQCQDLGAQRNQVADGAGGAAVGAALGAAGGAIIGAFTGNAGTGAALGASTGALTGGASSAHSSNRNRQDIVIKCMRNRGWSVVGR
ncbi:MAG: hypothetical protein IPM60_10725 [Rhodospirillales bacterium]|nr:hypothetical protein [Rhodospirillales bacterium]